MLLAKNEVPLIAGGAGFIGSHLCDCLLAQGQEVTCSGSSDQS